MDKIQQLMVITMEECGELTQVCSKLLRKRHTNDEISEETKAKLEAEFADVQCMMMLCEEYGLVKQQNIQRGIIGKRKKLATWSDLIMDANE